MAEEQKPLESLEVLVIEDEPAFRRIISLNLKLKGVIVAQAVNGQEGIEGYIKRYEAGKPYDAVFTDFRMPVADGIEVCRRIKGLNPTALVYLMTATQIEAREEVAKMPEGLRPDKVLDKNNIVLEMGLRVGEIRSVNYGGSAGYHL